jgi:hypothetical protein
MIWISSAGIPEVSAACEVTRSRKSGGTAPVKGGVVVVGVWPAPTDIVVVAVVESGAAFVVDVFAIVLETGGPEPSSPTFAIGPQAVINASISSHRLELSGMNPPATVSQP